MTTEFICRDPDLATGLAGRDPFAFFAGQAGETFRALQTRRTYAVELWGKRYFVKYHRGTPTAEILKNLLQFRLPVTSARNEWRALTRLRELGVAVPAVAAYGKRGWLPQRSESFIVTEDVGTQENLEDLTGSPVSFREKCALIREVANVSRAMHGQGICHRDFYICHFLVKGIRGNRLTLIDLHRALVKKHLPERWIVKDVGSLYFSVMDIGLSDRDLLRFVRHYTGITLKEALNGNRAFWEKVVGRARKLKARHG